jgi:hypothetical protein
MARFFGLGVLVAFLIIDAGNVYAMAAIDQWTELTIAVHFSIIASVLLSGFAGLLFRAGSRAGKAIHPNWRALLLGLAVVMAYSAITATASVVLLYFSIELSLALMLVPFLAICYCIPRLVR